MKKTDDKCTECGRQLTHDEMNWDKDVRGICGECFQLVIDSMVKKGEIEVFTLKKDGIPRVRLTPKGKKKAEKENRGH